MTMRQNNWTVGAYCAAYCRVVTTHHTIEDQALFPAAAPAATRGWRRWSTGSHYEHDVIHDVLDRGGPRAGRLRRRSGRPRSASAGRGRRLTDTLLSHLSYEERDWSNRIARLGVLG